MKTGRDGSDVSISPGMPWTAGSYQKPEERPGTDSLSEPPEGARPAHTLSQTSTLPSCDRINFCCFKPPGCGNLFWQSQDTYTVLKSGRWTEGLQGQGPPQLLEKCLSSVLPPERLLRGWECTLS